MPIDESGRSAKVEDETADMVESILDEEGEEESSEPEWSCDSDRDGEEEADG